LLQRVVERRDETAFATLVTRHGPMVLRVCRRVLGQEQDAEDAFQATFLVLARKAGSVRKRASAASWLYGVAYRTASNARRIAMRRHQHEQHVLPRVADSAASTAALRELQVLLDEEVQRLPESYRAPFVLCCLEGKSKPEAARQLGWKEGTVSGRLARARELLKSRLARRGVALPAALAVAALAPTEATAVPAPLTEATARCALAFASRQTADAVPVPLATLATGVLRGLTVAGAKHVLVGSVIVGLFALSVAVAARPLLVGRAPAAPGYEPAAAAAVVPEPADKAQQGPRDRFGDPLPPGARLRFGTVRFHHGYHAQGVAFAPDGKTLAAGGFGSVSLWDTTTGKELKRFGTPDAFLYSVAFPPDGRYVASGHGNKVILWDRTSGEQVRTVGEHGNVVHVVTFSRDGNVLASASADRTARLWDPATGQELRRFAGHGGEVRALALSADGKRLVTGADDKIVRLWDCATGQEVGRLRGHGYELYGVAFSPDGKLLASGGADGAVRIWDVQTQKELHRLEGRQTVRSVLFSPDGKVLAASDMDGLLRLFEPATGRLLRAIRQPDSAGGLAFSPDGRVLACAGAENGGIYRWDVATGADLRREEGHRGRVDQVAISPDGKLIASAGREPTIRLWSAATGEELDRLPVPAGGCRALVISSDGKLLAASGPDGVVRVWEAAPRKEVHAIEPEREFGTGRPCWRAGPQALQGQGGVGSLAFAPGGKTLAVAGNQGITLWDPHTGKSLRRLAGHGGWVSAVAFSADGRLLVSGGADGTVCLWDPADGKRVRQFPALRGEITGLALTPAGQYLVTAGGWAEGKGSDHTLSVWRTATGQQLRSWKAGNIWRPGLALSPDGKSVAAAQHDKLQIWELATGGERIAFTGHRGPITAVAFTPDGRTVVTGSEDSTLLAWDLTRPRPAGK
jgi:RNA polymerase sigma factor (sigma-70 family)